MDTVGKTGHTDAPMHQIVPCHLYKSTTSPNEHICAITKRDPIVPAR